MGDIKEETLPPYDHGETPHDIHEELPSYHAGPSTMPSQQGSSFPARPTLAIDPTGMSINSLSMDDTEMTKTLYTLNKSILKVNMRTTIEISRETPSTGDSKTSSSSLPVYAISYEFLAPIHTKKREMQDIYVARSHGGLTAVKLREIKWGFSITVPQNKSISKQIQDTSAGKSNPRDVEVGAGGFDFMWGGAPPGMVRRPLLGYHSNHGKWFDSQDDVVAIVREGGDQVAGMPVLSVVKDLDVEMLDFLVAAWCVTIWDEAGKKAREWSKGKGKK